MIGQQGLKESLDRSTARSILLTGPAHFGKKTFIREYLSNEESVFEVTGNSNEFREAVERICTTVRPTSYIIPDLDKRHPTVQNMLLKVIEEPPLKSKFYITASSSVLPTITSRCVLYRMLPYSQEDLSKVSVPDWVRPYGKSPGQLKLMNDESIGQAIPKIKEFHKLMLPNDHTLAWYLKEYREVDKVWRETNASQELFIWVVSEVFGSGSEAVKWLRQQPEDSTRYVRSQFILRYWIERQGLI